MTAGSEVSRAGLLHGYAMGYAGAFCALGISPGDVLVRELGELTDSPADMVAAIRAMATTERTWDRVHAALDVLRARRAGR